MPFEQHNGIDTDRKWDKASSTHDSGFHVVRATRTSHACLEYRPTVSEEHGLGGSTRRQRLVATYEKRAIWDFSPDQRSCIVFFLDTALCWALVAGLQSVVVATRTRSWAKPGGI